MGVFLLSTFYLVMYHLTPVIHAQNLQQQGLMLYLSSICKPRETLVKVRDEFPEIMHIHVVPPCVPLQRCGGCCNDEAMACVNVSTHTTMIQDAQGEVIHNFIELPFVEHSQCQCRLIEDQ